MTTRAIRTIRATARLQLHAGFTFVDAARQAGYFATLGVSHLYLSPICCARPGSTHGYDVTDYRHIDPALGGEAGFLALSDAAHRHGLGLVLDIVPNHMAASPEHNAWWRDVLAYGLASRYARYFDIDWTPPEPTLRGKVLLPLLAQPYGKALESGDIALAVDQQTGAMSICCAGTDLPLAPETMPAISANGRSDGYDPRTAQGRAQLHALLEQQHYRLAWWRTAADMLNWRRFFEISELIGMRVEAEDVFEAIHALVFQLYRSGLIDGVRVDHVDGLADPIAYCQRLRTRLTALAADRPADHQQDAPWIVVEKILAPDEVLERDWMVDGTTGYDFMNDIAAVLHSAHGIAKLQALWKTHSGDWRPCAEQIASTRHEVLTHALVTEAAHAARNLYAASRSDMHTRDLAHASLSRALAALLSNLPVYRTCFTASRRSPQDRKVLHDAAMAARAALHGDDWSALECLVRCLEGGDDTPSWNMARTRIQQLMPPLAAKAVEDTLFYRDGAVLSRNEVGSAPGAQAMTLTDFHRRAAARAAAFPHTMLATATHDHKRGEDTRMRLAVLSEIPQTWRTHVARWDAPWRKTSAPDGPDRLMLYQTLVGAWPLDLTDIQAQPEALAAFLVRIRAWQRKAVREAGRHGDWTRPDTAYEAACDAFLDALQLDGLDRIAAFAQRISVAGALNSLTQTLVHICTPGVPDCYQGTERWDFTLVDPDNRLPVNFAYLRSGLACQASWMERMEHWRDGRVKQQLIRTLLAARHDYESVLCEGAVTAIDVAGSHAAHVLALCRTDGQHHAVAIGTRLAARLLKDHAMPCVPATRWGNTAIAMPGSAGDHWIDLITGARHEAHAGNLQLHELLDTLPVALLVPEP